MRIVWKLLIISLSLGTSGPTLEAQETSPKKLGLTEWKPPKFESAKFADSLKRASATNLKTRAELDSAKRALFKKAEDSVSREAGSVAQKKVPAASSQLSVEVRTVYRAYFNRTLVDGNAVADAILRDEGRSLRATFKEYKETFAKSHFKMHFATPRDLADYLRGLEVVECRNATTAEVLLGALKITTDRSGRKVRRIEYGYSRKFRPGEMCLFDRNANMLVMSLMCGNPALEAVGMPPAQPGDVPKAVEVPVFTAPSVAVPLAAIPLLATSAPVALMAKKDSSKTSPALVAGASHRRRNAAISIGIAAVVACAIWCPRGTKKAQPANKQGGPVNPLNNLLSLMSQPSLGLGPD